MVHLPPGAAIGPDETYFDGAYDEPPADPSEGRRGSNRSPLSDALTALVVVGLPVVVVVVLGTPRLEPPTRWPDVKTLVNDGTLPGGLTLNLIILILAVAWLGSLALLVASVANRLQGRESSSSNQNKSRPDKKSRRRERQQEEQAEDEAAEPWYRQGPPLFTEPIADIERVEPPGDAEPGVDPVGAGLDPGGGAESHGGFSLSGSSLSGSAPSSPPMGAGPAEAGHPMMPMDAGLAGTGQPMAPAVQEAGMAPLEEPPEIVPIRAYYVARSADTLRSVAAQFLNSPARWEEVRSLNAAYPGIAALGPDDLITEGSALMLPGDPMPWGKPDPVYLWTLAERFLFTAWGREPAPSEVVPFWKGLALGMEIDEDALDDLGELRGAAAALTPPVGPLPDAPAPFDQPPTAGIPMPQAPAPASPAPADATQYPDQPPVDPDPATAPAYDLAGPDPAAVDPTAAPAYDLASPDPAAAPTDAGLVGADPVGPDPAAVSAGAGPAAAFADTGAGAADAPLPTADSSLLYEPPAYTSPDAEPPAHQPSPSEPAAYQPPVAEPPTYQPPTDRPPPYEAPVAEPPSESPSYEQPAAEPSVGEPPSYEQPAAEPPSYEQQPAAYQPPIDRPPPYEAPAAEPPSYEQPPVAEPPAYEPPAGEPPTYQPPAGEPPTYQPPTYEPPAGEPPPYEPPTYQPPTYQPPAAEPPTYQPPTAYESPVQPPYAAPPTEPIAPEAYVEQEAPPLPQFMPSVTGPDATVQQQMGGLGVTQRSLAGTAIGDAMLLWRLSRLRQRRGGPGRPTGPDPLVESLERNARMDSLRLIEAAMRQLRAVTVAQLKEKPKVMAVRVGAYGFEVLLDEPAAAPEGWRAASGGYVLELNEGTSLEQLDASGHGMSLCPALVPVGDTVEGPLLLNLEEIRCLMVSGTSIASANLLTSVAEALGSSPMASDVRVVTVGVNAPVGPGWERILATSFDSPQLERLLIGASGPEPASGGLDVLVVGPGHDVLVQRAGQIASSPRSNLALVGATSSAAARWPWRIHVDDAARAVVQPIACTMRAAQAMSPELAASLSAEAADQMNPPPGF